MPDKCISVVLAHPDDESFGMGGTLAKYAAQNISIHVILATRGEAGIPGLDPDATGMRREAEAGAACAVLGVDELTFLGFLDGELTTVPDDEAILLLVQKLQEQRPDVVLTFGPDGVSGHPDHITVSRWATSAFDRLRPSPGGPRKLYYLALRQRRSKRAADRRHRRRMPCPPQLSISLRSRSAKFGPCSSTAVSTHHSPARPRLRLRS